MASARRRRRPSRRAPADAGTALRCLRCIDIGSNTTRLLVAERQRRAAARGAPAARLHAARRGPAAGGPRSRARRSTRWPRWSRPSRALARAGRRGPRARRRDGGDPRRGEPRGVRRGRRASAAGVEVSILDGRGGGAAGLRSARRARSAARATDDRRRRRRRRRLDRDRGRDRRPAASTWCGVVPRRLGRARRRLPALRPAGRGRARARCARHAAGAFGGLDVPAARRGRRRRAAARRRCAGSSARRSTPTTLERALARARRRAGGRGRRAPRPRRPSACGCSRPACSLLDAAAQQLGCPLQIGRGGLREGVLLELAPATGRPRDGQGARHPGLDPGEPSVRGGRARPSRVRAEELFEHADGVLDTDDIERVHDMRVATRRLRAVLEIFAPVLPRATRTRGAARRQGARRRARRAPRPRRAARRAARARRRALPEARSGLAIQRSPSGCAPSRPRATSALAAALERSPSAATCAGGCWSSAARGGGREGAQGQGARPRRRRSPTTPSGSSASASTSSAPSCPGRRDPAEVDALHDMRIAAKRLRYILEVTGAVLRPVRRDGGQARQGAAGPARRDPRLRRARCREVEALLDELRRRTRRASRAAAGDADDLDPRWSPARTPEPSAGLVAIAGPPARPPGDCSSTASCDALDGARARGLPRAARVRAGERAPASDLTRRASADPER